MYCSSTYLEEGVVTSEKVVLFLCDKPPDGYCKVRTPEAAQNQACDVFQHQLQRQSNNQRWTVHELQILQEGSLDKEVKSTTNTFQGFQCSSSRRDSK
ncbi:hypothetical protein MRX96_019294 [Rhipicephalus microplus]